MPKARQEVEAIMERLKLVRSEIEQLSEAAEQVSLYFAFPRSRGLSHAAQKVKPASQPSTTIPEEEKRIQELHLKIKQMKARVRDSRNCIADLLHDGTHIGRGARKETKALFQTFCFVGQGQRRGRILGRARYLSQASGWTQELTYPYFGTRDSRAG